MPDVFEKSMPTPERAPVSPETKPASGAERPREQEASHEEQSVAESTPLTTPVEPAPVQAQPTPVDPVLASVERILSEDLNDFYRSMPPAEQAKFLKKGEEVASKIRALVERAALKAKDVLNLIIGWLKLIPGVNKFFLEQESKIKTDKIMELHNRERGL